MRVRADACVRVRACEMLNNRGLDAWMDAVPSSSNLTQIAVRDDDAA